MGAKLSPRDDIHVPAFHKSFSDSDLGAAKDLTAQLNYPQFCACALSIGASTAGTIVVKDAAGNSATYTVPVGLTVIRGQFSELTSIATFVGTVVAHWMAEP